MRLGRIGHLDGQTILSSLRPIIGELIAAPVPGLDDAEAYAPQTEIAAMRHETQDASDFFLIDLITRGEEFMLLTPTEMNRLIIFCRSGVGAEAKGARRSAQSSRSRGLYIRTKSLKEPGTARPWPN